MNSVVVEDGFVEKNTPFSSTHLVEVQFIND